MMRTMIAALMAAAVSAENLSEHRRLQASTTCADFNGDAQVDVSDLLLLLANFGDTGASAICDTNGDSAGEAPTAPPSRAATRTRALARRALWFAPRNRDATACCWLTSLLTVHVLSAWRDGL